MKEKVIILKLKAEAVFWNYINKVPVQRFYNKKEINLFMKIMIKLNLDKWIWGDWKKHIEEYQQIIIFDNGYKESIAKYIKRKNKDCKIIFYYWNPIMKNNEEFLQDKNLDEIWTFDKKDAQKYHLKYNPQFYTNSIRLKKQQEEYDAYFLGRAKDREKTLKSLQNVLEKQNLKTLFKIVYSKDDIVSYSEYLNILSKTKSIVDIVATNQTGLTLRCLESMFLQKKLITNNKDIVNYDFYNPNNIFIIGKDDMAHIKEFIHSKYMEIDKKIKEKYEFESWLNRILNDEKREEDSIS